VFIRAVCLAFIVDVLAFFLNVSGLTTIDRLCRVLVVRSFRLRLAGVMLFSLILHEGRLAR
jgi:hypothetical protein